jgi:hypothetical protein
MPVSNYKPDQPNGIAVTAETLYLINLLLLPGLGFVILLILYWIKHNNVSALNLNHLQQTVFASIWGGSLIIVINALIILLGGYEGAYTWMIVVLYFTVVHSTFILLGMVGLIKALAGQCWSYPVIGRPIPEDC